MTTYGPPTAQEHLRQAMRHSTDPRWVERQLCNDYADPGPDIIKPSRIPWGIVITAIIGIGFSLFLIGYAYASEPPRPWIVWDETTDKPWLSKKGEPATATGPTACILSLHEVAKATQDGTRLSCRRIDEARR